MASATRLIAAADTAPNLRACQSESVACVQSSHAPCCLLNVSEYDWQQSLVMHVATGLICIKYSYEKRFVVLS